MAIADRGRRQRHGARRYRYRERERVSRVPTIVVPERRAVAREPLEQRSGLPAFAVFLVKGGYALVHLPQPDGIGVKHRTAAIRGESVAGEIDHIDVRGARRNSLFENPCPFVDQGIHAALEDLLIALRDARDSGSSGRTFDDARDLRVWNRLAITGFVAKPALAGLLAETIHRD